MVTESDPPGRRGHSAAGSTGPGRPQARQRDSRQRLRTRPAITIIGKPRISVDGAGTHVTFDVANKGPVRLNGSVGIDINGTSVTLQDPSLRLTADGGPVTVSYDLADSSASIADRVTVVVKDSVGRTLSTSASATTIGIGTTVGAVTVAAGLGLGAYVFLPDREPDPVAVTPVASEPEPEPMPLSEVALPSTITARHDSGWSWPIGEPAALRLTLGPPQAIASGSTDENLRAVTRTVRASYGPRSVDLGTIELLEAFTTPDPPGGSWTLGEQDASGVDLLGASPVAHICFRDGDRSDLLGGYLATGPGELSIRFVVDLTDTGSTSWRAEVAWEGSARLELVDGVDVGTVDTSEAGCPPELAAANVTWTASR